ncbi:hypothetical protein GLOIN_2v1785908 [Rhizophagus irregularis DAOM 181602=DAOM 197198]|nr:hypothetical protein GLOIN_2v1785908 [Rhizophagus irregularis DAOM 181602=DAOM 197198]
MKLLSGTSNESNVSLDAIRSNEDKSDSDKSSSVDPQNLDKRLEALRRNLVNCEPFCGNVVETNGVDDDNPRTIQPTSKSEGCTGLSKCWRDYIWEIPIKDFLAASDEYMIQDGKFFYDIVNSC